MSTMTIDDIKKHSISFIAIDFGPGEKPAIHLSPDDPEFDEDTILSSPIRKGFEPYEYIDTDIYSSEEYELFPEDDETRINNLIEGYRKKREQIVASFDERELLKYDRAKYNFAAFTSSIPLGGSFTSVFNNIFEDRSERLGYALSQKEVGKAIGLSESQLSRRLNNKYPISHDEFIKVCIYLCIDKQELSELTRRCPYVNICDNVIPDTIFRDLVEAGYFSESKLPSARTYKENIDHYKKHVVGATKAYNTYILDSAETYLSLAPSYVNPEPSSYDQFLESFGPVDMHTIPFCLVDNIVPGHPIEGQHFVFLDDIYF